MHVCLYCHVRMYPLLPISFFSRVQTPDSRLPTPDARQTTDYSVVGIRIVRFDNAPPHYYSYSCLLRICLAAFFRLRSSVPIRMHDISHISHTSHVSHIIHIICRLSLLNSCRPLQTSFPADQARPAISYQYHLARALSPFPP